MRLGRRRVLAGDAADQPGRLGGELPAVGAQRAAPGQREPGREGDPQLRAGGQGRPGRAGPVGVVDLAVPDPGAGCDRDGRGAGTGGGVEVLDSRRLGGAWTLDRMWERLGIGAAIRRVAAGRRLDGDAVERVVFALVAQRAFETGLEAGRDRLGRRAGGDRGCPGFTEDAAYAAMDFLLDAWTRSPPRCSPRSRTCSTWIWTSCSWTPPPPTGRPRPPTSSPSWPRPAATTSCSSPTEAGTRAFGHSKDHRADLPQVVIAMAVTRDGVPVRCWTFPGNTADTAIIRTIKDDLGGWGLRRLVWVADRGFASAANRAYLTRGGGHYIHAEKLRHTNTEAAAALARPGPLPHRRRQPAGQGGRGRPGGDGDGDGRRRRPHPAVRDLPQPRTGRTRPAGPGQPRRAPAQLIDGSDTWTARRRDELVGASRPSPGCAATCGAPRPGCCGSTRPRSSGRRTWTASGCCVPPTPP